MMLKGTLDTAVGIDWERPWIKILLGKWRIIVRWLLWLSSWLELQELPLVGTYTRNSYNKTRVANEELGDFLKLLNRQNSKLQHWLKPGSLNCKKTC
jgi:hypothetical protein